jgi:hypothetical protein
MTWTPPPATCVRSAWLTLGSLTVGLEGPGWFCPSLDLGFPEVREVVSNRPDQDGIDDRTQYFGARAVTADITALAGAGARIDAVAAQFAPFMVPSARPTLHYVLDRPGSPERTMKLRAAGYSWPIAGPSQRDIQLQWVADDPAALDPAEQTVIAYRGSSSAAGRLYNLTFNRIYPTGGASPSTGHMVIGGDLPVRPRLRIYGPVTGAQVDMAPGTAGGPKAISVAFLNSFTIGAGHYVEVSTANRTAYLDGDASQSVIASIDWYRSVWGVLPANTTSYLTFIIGSTTSGITQVQASWHDRYLT